MHLYARSALGGKNLLVKQRRKANGLNLWGQISLKHCHKTDLGCYPVYLPPIGAVKLVLHGLNHSFVSFGTFVLILSQNQCFF